MTPDTLKKRSELLYDDLQLMLQQYSFCYAMYCNDEIHDYYYKTGTVDSHSMQRGHGFHQLRYELFLSLLGRMKRFQKDATINFASLQIYKDEFKEAFYTAKIHRSSELFDEQYVVLESVVGRMQESKKELAGAPIDLDISFAKLNKIRSDFILIADQLDLLINDVSHGHLPYDEITKATLGPV